MITILIPVCAFFLVKLHRPEGWSHSSLKERLCFCEVNDVNCAFAFIVVSHAEIKPLHFALAIGVISHKQVVDFSGSLTHLVQICAFKACIENHIVLGPIYGFSHLIRDPIDFFQINFIVLKATLPRCQLTIIAEALP